MGAYGVSAAIATPIGVGSASLIGPIVPIVGWAACGLIPFRLLWTFDTKHPALPTNIIDAEQQIYSCTIPRGRFMSACGVMACLGAFSSPAIWMISAMHPTILPTAVALTAGCFGGATLVAMRSPSESLLKWQAPLGSAVVGLCGISIAQICASMLGCPILQLTEVLAAVAGVGVFSSLTAVDAQVLIRSYHDAQLDPVGHGMKLALNAVNMLSDFLRILKAIHDAVKGDNDD